MGDWQERITRETDPSIRIEHDVRYALAMPLIRDGELWADLGCGNGVAAADALGDEPAGRVLLVDADEDAAEEAGRNVPARDVTALRADLTSPEDLGRVREALDGATGTITCFETVEHLKTFAPLLEALLALSDRYTVLLSVPNDAFWALENPYHETVWGEGSFAELRSLLPEDHVVAHQVSLHGSAVLPVAAQRAELALAATVDGEAVPTQFMVAFGPHAARIAAGGAVTQTDLAERRRWERQRDSDIAYFAGVQAQLDQALADLRRIIDEREQFRNYVAQLEERLGLPNSVGGQTGPTAALPPA